ncbi:MAG: type II toxin-antitoxin system VapC family toxin [Nitrospirae bacterium]|nr:type II toxin-antitoxin system VapC family toxin [Nitrospirota bacterium]
MSGDKKYVLDTSALFSLIEDEDGADEVERLLQSAESGEIEIFISFVTLTEVFYVTSQERDEKTALKRINLIKRLKLTIVESNEQISIAAGKIKAANKVSLADSFVAATSTTFKAVLVHKDPEFDCLSSKITILGLPYKK